MSEFSEGRNTAAYIAALTDELAGLERTGKPERAAAVKAELARLGAGAKPPVKRAQKRVKAPAESRGA